MEKLKQNAIKLLLSKKEKEDFEKELYEKVEITDLNTNEFLFDLVAINYRGDNYRKELNNLLRRYLTEEAFIIFSIELSCISMNETEDKNIIYSKFYEIFDFFDYENEYELMWGFYFLNEKIDLVEAGYKREIDVLKEIQIFINKVCSQLKLLSSLEEKIDFLINGFENENLLEVVDEVDNKKKILKKWYQFWK